MNKILKVGSIFFLILIVFFSFSNIFAAYEKSNIDLKEYTIRYREHDERYISYNGVSQRFFDYYYLDNYNNPYPAYCINLGSSGAENGEYNVNVEEKISDDTVTSIILNGFPNRTIAELGLNSDCEAIFATQFAVWVYTSNLDTEKIEALSNETERVKNAIINIYNNGKRGEIPNNKVKFIPLDDEFKIDEIDNSYISRRYRIEYDPSMVIDIRSASDNSIVKMTTVDNVDLGKYTDTNEVKLLIPRDKISSNTNINF